MKIFTVHDSKAETYMQPLFYKTSAMALRSFTEAVKDTSTDFHKFSSDYTLVELGEYDDATASIVTHEKPRILANASEFIQ